MLLLLSAGTSRPNRLEDKKDDQYHIKWARYAAFDANTYLHQEYLAKTLVNKNFYKGEQWFFAEDLESFFKDETGQGRNRLKMRHNIIRPMVEQFRGNALRMKIKFGAKSISSKAINRREQKLEEMKYYTFMANAVHPSLGDSLREKLPIGKTQQETAEIFENLWVDGYSDTIEGLMQYVSELNNFEDKQVRVAEELAFSGLATIEEYEHNGHQYFDLLRSEDYFWDRSAKEYDHSDAEYRGRQHYMNATDMYEDYELLSFEDKNAIEKYAKSYQRNSSTETQMLFGGKVPVLKVYWKDTEEYKYGYVLDEYGYPYLTRIDFTYEGEEKPRYTDEDVIIVNSERSREVLGNKKTRKLSVDVIRFCHFVPQEIISSTSSGGGDIMLDYGILPYQETDNLDISSVKYPFKTYCWGYINGEVLSPIDDAIDPQRFLNRLLSVAENQINNSRGSGTIYDKMVIDPNGGEAEMLKNMNQSKPVGVNAKGRGVQNVIGSYDASINKGTLMMFDIMNTIKNQLKDVTGLNEAIQGESMGADQLVGVTQLMIQRGSLMQESFYNAVTQVFKQSYQSIASVGKRIYADNARELAIAVGDNGAKIITISKDMKGEDFRTFIKRENSEDVLFQAGNSMALTLLQEGFLNKQEVADLFNRSTPDDVARALRKSAKTDIERARIQSQQQAQASDEEQQHQTAEEQKALMLKKYDDDREDKNTALAQDNELDKIIAKGITKQLEITAAAKNTKPTEKTA